MSNATRELDGNIAVYTTSIRDLCVMTADRNADGTLAANGTDRCLMCGTADDDGRLIVWLSDNGGERVLYDDVEAIRDVCADMADTAGGEHGDIAEGIARVRAALAVIDETVPESYDHVSYIHDHLRTIEAIEADD